MAFKNYYSLAKPGIIYGNIVTLVGGFAIAARGRVDAAGFGLLFAALLGLSLVIAAGSVCNNLIDRDIDAKMERTKHRALVVGSVSHRSALIYGTCLGLAGFFILFVYTNVLTAGIAIFGLFAYVVLYTLWSKRRSVYGPIVGSISGAVPPVVGYCAASNRFDTGAIILFAVLCLWQIPHFFAISIYRSDEYTAADVPVLPARKGIRNTKIQMLIYIAAFTVAAIALAGFGYAGNAYLASAMLLSAAWFGFCIRGFWARDNKRWARKMFLISLVVLMLLFIMMSVDVARG